MKIFALIMVMLSMNAFAQVETKTVVYGGGKFEGFVTQPKNAKGKLPAILMIHNWAGVSDETKFQAARYAELGYVVLGADVYGKGNRPKNRDENRAYSTKYKSDRKLFRQNLDVAHKYLASLKNVDRKKIVAFGYCFGGTGALELARNGNDLRGAVSFHGGLDSPTHQDGKNIKAKILVLHGAIDPNILGENEKQLVAFEKEMKDHSVNYRLVKYEGAVHSFTDKGAGNDPSKGNAYNEAADKASFEEAKNFLAEVTK